MRLMKLSVLLLCMLSLAVLSGCPQTAGVAVIVAKSTISVGEVTTATAVSSDSKDTFTWTSSANAIASVATDGKVTGVAAGKANITATASNSKQTASVEITVVAAAEGEGEAVVEGEGEVVVEGEGEVVVPDTTAPVITRLGAATVVLLKDATYTDAGATASDNVDGDITANIVVVNPVNTAVVGNYTVTYNVSDAAGNPAVQVTRTVQVILPEEVPVNVNLKYNRLEGRNNVGLGMDVELSSTVWPLADGDVDAYNWHIISKPANSATELVADGGAAAFRPDVQGVYTVELIVDRTLGAGGVAQYVTTGDIYAGTFKGAGIVTATSREDASIDPLESHSTCTQCHDDVIAPDKVTPWLRTGHASFLIRNLNNWDGAAQAAYHYGGSCVSCHSVGYDKGSVNGGFDEFIGTWLPPAWEADMSNHWNSLVVANPDAAALGNIQCESCHGPASQHMASTDTRDRISSSLDSEACLPCHGEPPRHDKFGQLQLSGHSQAEQLPWSDWDTANPQVVPTSTTDATRMCARCHSAYGYIEFSETGGVANPPLPHALTCATCHDPHDATNPSQLRTYDTFNPPWNWGTELTGFGASATCMSCHNGRRGTSTVTDAHTTSSRAVTPHGIPAAAELLSTNAFFFGQTPKDSPHAYSTMNVGCVDCHMAVIANVNDAHRNKVGDHTFKLTYASDTEGEFENIGVGCNTADCHNGGITELNRVTSRDYDGNGTAEGVETEIDGLLAQTLTAITAAYPGLSYNGSTWTPTPEKWELADDPATLDVVEGLGLTPGTGALKKLRALVWNYTMIAGDPGAAVHNTKFAAGVLQATINAAKGSEQVWPYKSYTGALTPNTP